MKKLLVALLLLALTLTSCTVPGGGETSDTSDGITTAENTTDENTTNGEPTETEDQIVIYDPTPNYLSWEPNWQRQPLEVPDEKAKLLIETPLFYEVETQAFLISFDFHQKFYRVGDPLQVTVTIKNITEEDQSFIYNFFEMILLREDGESLGYNTKYYNSGRDVKEPQHEQGNYTEPSIYRLPILPGESLRVERVIDLEPDFLESEKLYELRFFPDPLNCEELVIIPLYSFEKDYVTAGVASK